MLTLNVIVFWPFLVYAAAVLVIVAIMLGLSHILGERHKEKLTGEPFESGIAPTGICPLKVLIPFLFDCHIFRYLRSGCNLHTCLGYIVP